MRISSIFAFVVTCVVLSIGVCTHAQKRNHEKSKDKGIRQQGEYSLTVGKQAKRTRVQSIRNIWRLSKAVSRPRNLSGRKSVVPDSTCQDRVPLLCNSFMRLYGAKINNDCAKVPVRHYRKRLMKKCKKTCGLCDNLEEKPKIRNEFKVIRRRGLPFPAKIGGHRRSHRSRSDRSKPQSGVYYIFTRQVSL